MCKHILIKIGSSDVFDKYLYTYEFNVSTPRCVYVMSALICNNSRFNLHTRSFAIANSAFNSSGSCRWLIELLDEYTKHESKIE